MRVLRTAALAALLALVLCAPAGAKDPGRWTLSGWSSVSNFYWQGVTSAGPTAPLYFSGPVEGLYRTDRFLNETAAISPAIPASVRAVEGYNHVGDISFDGRDGRRVLLPLECYDPGGRGQHLRDRGDRDGRSEHAGLPLLREARPCRDREGHVGRGFPGRSSVDLERERPAGLPRRGRQPGERVSRGAADPLRAAPGGCGAAQRRDRSHLPRRAAVPGGRPGNDLPGVVREPRHGCPPAGAGTEERAGRGGGSPHHVDARRHAPLPHCPAGAEAHLRPDRRAAALHAVGSAGPARERHRNAPTGRFVRA